VAITYPSSHSSNMVFHLFEGTATAVEISTFVLLYFSFKADASANRCGLMARPNRFNK
jgi:hypothetical protein